MGSPGRHSDLRTQTRRIVRHRYLLLAFVAGCGAVLAGGRGDWNFFVAVGRDLLRHSGFDVYVKYGDAQTGPFTLLSAALLSLGPRNGFVACVLLCAGAGVLAIRTVELTARFRFERVRIEYLVLTGGLLVQAWWSLLGAYGHLDDAIVLLCAVLALYLHTSDRPTAAALVIAVACGFKPWGVIFWPLSLPQAVPLRKREAWIGPLLAGTVTAVIWLPFVLSLPSSVGGLAPTVSVADDSVLRAIALDDYARSPVLRVGQLVAASLAALIAVHRRRPEMVIISAVSVRLLLDPGTWGYYTAGLVLGAFILDACIGRGVWPWRTIVASVALAPSWIMQSPELRSWMRAALCVGVLVALALPAQSTNTRSRRASTRVGLDADADVREIGRS